MGVGELQAASDGDWPVLSGTLGVMLMLNGVAQIAGLGLGITGAVRLGSARRTARLSATGTGLRLQF